MKSEHPSGFSIDDLTIGPFAHGFGTTDDGRPFAFRTVRSTLRLEIYRADLDTDVPAPEDVVAVAEVKVTDIDLDDERSVIALVRDLVPEAEPTVADRDVTTVRALLGRISSVIDGM
ncbi:hypothetical protein GV791_24385 [Nocardia cyriacigeorgica]|uniref:Uncharacterized protein n=2 Tax=Nocardia cyriacigeorgica TaxID=135487 RepID=H6R811_NOCCG|nr:hypothetical protein [Nocardia cyriacigeorgica]MBF6288604.1 hypothetical protein [Nocardia cyriacigeorgica]MBF6427618.1 hypothetical protein [Nocardia cyriacigeorgica]NEW35681.1 hypothetical protein [Nocardia cyriacigeorgica]CCF63555.1 conserved protein of unknown function [Nocardia cyriacigeorgica GUH-2]BDT87206.1 hypothetical protein FMUAM8_29700 [Nocardia cyriacigeorgica]